MVCTERMFSRMGYLKMKRNILVPMVIAFSVILWSCGAGSAASSSNTVAPTSGSAPDSSSTGGSGSTSSGSSASSGSSSTPTVSDGFPHSDHVFVVMLENQSFSQIFPSGDAGDCSSSAMPYLCGLAVRNGLALNFYSNAHGSLYAYLYDTSGAKWSGKPYDCTGSRCAYAGVITGDNIVRALTASGKTWRGYFEGMPSQGYMGGRTGNYTADHNPFKWYSDVAGSTAQQRNMYPFTQFSQDVQADTFQNFNYLVPNLLHDAEGTKTQTAKALLGAADEWLETNIGPLLSTTPFQPGGNGILIITFDEGRVKGKSGDTSEDDSCSPTDSSGCGGHVAFVMVGPNVIAGSTATATYHFQDMLHTIVHLLGMSDYMNAAGKATDIALLPGIEN